MIKDYRITSNYGWRTHPITGKKSFHAGIDLVKHHKAPIEAFTSGVVMYAGLGKAGTGLGGYGNVVVIQDNNYNIHVYAHLDSVSVVTGDRVIQNGTIGYQGATGNVTGSHLHYEVRKNARTSYGWTSNPESSTLDPIKYIERSGGRMVKKLVEDGKPGKETYRRMQQFLGVKQDGVAGVKTWKAFQKFLNTYGQ